MYHVEYITCTGNALIPCFGSVKCYQKLVVSGQNGQIHVDFHLPTICVHQTHVRIWYFQ